MTFRTADSIPQAVYREWQHKRLTWLKARNIDVNRDDWKSRLSRLPSHEQQVCNRYFGQKLFTELDKCHGACVMKNLELASIVANALVLFHGSRVETGDFAVLPNHVHALLTPIGGFELEQVLHSIKSYTANQINQRLGNSSQFWMHESHDHIVRDDAELLRIQGYIRRNPEQARLTCSETIVQKAEYEIGRSGH